MAWQAVWTNSLGALTESQKEQNVDILYYFFHNLGWEDKPIAAMFGNMELESQMNPAQWENGKQIEGEGRIGFGLCQWTPWTKLADWLGTGWETNYNGQLQRIQWESLPENQGNINPNGQWIPVYNAGGFNFGGYTFQQFAHDTTHELPWLTACYEYSYERGTPAINTRVQYAQRWYEYIQSGPTPPTPTPTSRGKMPLWMMLKPYYRRYR